MLCSALADFPEKKSPIKDKIPAEAVVGDIKIADEKANDKASLPTKSLRNKGFFTKRAPKLAGSLGSFWLLVISLILKLPLPTDRLSPVNTEEDSLGPGNSHKALKRLNKAILPVNTQFPRRLIQSYQPHRISQHGQSRGVDILGIWSLNKKEG
jgi:hypothetical protein